MQKFNNILNTLAMITGGCPTSNCPAPVQNATPVNCPQPDSNVGETGKINGDEENSDKIVLEIGGGIELHLPMEIAKQIAASVNGNCDEDEKETDEQE